MNFKKWLAVGLGVAALFGASVPSYANGRDLAVLVVGRSSDSAMAARERVIIDQLTKLRVARGWNHKLLPIYSYHFEKSAEKSYCEDRLKVKASDLVVVGLVELESGVPVDFVYRENDVMTAEPVAGKVMDRARAELAARGRVASTTSPVAAPPSPKPPAPNGTRPTPSTAAVTPRPSPRPVAASPTTKPAPAPSTKPVAAQTTKPATVAVTTAPSTPTMKPIVLKPAPPAATKPAPVRPAAPVRPIPVVAAPKPSTKPVAVTPAATKPAGPPASGVNEHWAVQVGLFSTLEKARLMVEKLKESNIEGEIRKGMKDGAVVFRVIVGSFKSQAEAYAQAKAMTEAGTAGFSVRVDSALGQVVK